MNENELYQALIALEWEYDECKDSQRKIEIEIEHRRLADLYEAI